jgi:hypothetical protein
MEMPFAAGQRRLSLRLRCCASPSEVVLAVTGPERRRSGRGRHGAADASVGDEQWTAEVAATTPPALGDDAVLGRAGRIQLGQFQLAELERAAPVGERATASLHAVGAESDAGPTVHHRVPIGPLVTREVGTSR